MNLLVKLVEAVRFRIEFLEPHAFLILEEGNRIELSPFSQQWDGFQDRVCAMQPTLQLFIKFYKIISVFSFHI